MDTDGNAIQNPTIITDYSHNMGGVNPGDQQLDSLDALRKLYKWYKKPFVRLVRQCALAAHKFYEKEERIISSSFNTYAHYFFRMHHNWQDSATVALDNTARLADRNHWPVKRESPKEWKAMKSKTK